MFSAQPLILLRIDVPLHLFWWPALLIQSHLFSDALDQAQLIIAIHNLEVFTQPCILPVRAQQSMCQAVEGAHPHSMHIDV